MNKDYNTFNSILDNADRITNYDKHVEDKCWKPKWYYSLNSQWYSMIFIFFFSIFLFQIFKG